MKKHFAVLLTGLLTAVIMMSFTACASNKGKDEIDPILAFAAAEANKMTPRQVDEETRWDTVLALPRNTLRYVYTLLNYAKDDLDMALLKEVVEPEMRKALKGQEGLQVFRDRKTTIEIQYLDKNGAEAFVITLKYKDY